MNASGGRRVIGRRYELTERLGRGGSGTVWRGQDLAIQRPVAIKEIAFTDRRADEREESRQRLLREVRAAGQLHHPASVTVFDVLWQERTAYVVMELVEAPTLQQLLKSGPLSVEQATRIALDVLDALEEAHRANLVHRDVKPSNIMVPAHGTAKLTDFGIVHMVEDSRLTHTGMILGSPAYLAPEQGSRDPITPATDLCQLGITLYAMLEGRSPFERDRPDHASFAAMAYIPEPPSCGGELAEMVTALLDKDPARRPNAAAVRSVLRKPFSGRRRSRRVPRHSCRRRGKSAPMIAVISAVAVAGAAITAGTMWALSGQMQGSDARPPVVRWDTFRGVDFVDRTSVNLSAVNFEEHGCANGTLRQDEKPWETPCAEDHRIEFFSSFAYPGSPDSPYPKPADLDGEAIRVCEARFDAYQRNPWVRDLPVALTVLPPSQNRWNSGSDFHNVVYCAATRTDGRSFHNSALKTK